ncbi:MAG: hypothetical protein HW416_3423 [Chloroflexi bacterium]|nr:hypothetical protein [Chloroflexota bacterium]
MSGPGSAERRVSKVRTDTRDAPRIPKLLVRSGVVAQREP